MLQKRQWQSNNPISFREHHFKGLPVIKKVVIRNKKRGLFERRKYIRELSKFLITIFYPNQCFQCYM